MSKRNWEKIVIVENREFRIKFWYDSWNLFYTSIEEKITIKPAWYNRKGYYYEQISGYRTPPHSAQAYYHASEGHSYKRVQAAS